MTCGIVAVGSEVERAVGGEGRIEVVAVFGVDGCGKNRRIGPYARRCVALGDPDAEARHFALRRWADRCEVELGAVGVEMRRDVERGSGKRQRLGWPPMAVLEVADAEHRKTWRRTGSRRSTSPGTPSARSWKSRSATWCRGSS